MAHLLAIVNPHPAPVPGQETRALVYMSYEPAPDEASSLPMHAPHGPGYRISVHAAESGRELGRWVSDCALTVTQNALLWLSMYPWEVQPAQGSIDYLSVMEQVAEHAPNPPGAPPRELLMSLSLNFPGMKVDLPPEPPPGIQGDTGVRLLAPPAPQSPVVSQQTTPARRQLTARAPVVEQQAPPAPPAPEAAPVVAPKRPTPGGLDGEELELGRFLARSINALKKGAGADEILDAMGGLLDTYEPEDEDYIEDEDVLDDEDFESEVEESDHNGVELHSEEPRYRPLMPGEIPEGMSPDQLAALEALGGDDDRLRAKLERTRNNNASIIMRARQVAAMNEEARRRAAEEEVAQAETIVPEVDESPEVELPKNGGGKGRVTKKQLVDSLVAQDPNLVPKSLMRLKKDELLAMM